MANNISIEEQRRLAEEARLEAEAAARQRAEQEEALRLHAERHLHPVVSGTWRGTGAGT